MSVYVLAGAPFAWCSHTSEWSEPGQRTVLYRYLTKKILIMNNCFSLKLQQNQSEKIMWVQYPNVGVQANGGARGFFPQCFVRKIRTEKLYLRFFFNLSKPNIKRTREHL